MTHDMADRDLAARARQLAHALRELTGGQAAITPSRRGGLRVTLRVTAQPDQALAEAVARVLARGDRFGHSRSRRWERLWAEIDPLPEREVAQ
ncbi:hypothetical protein [Kitasatospora sp. NPDC059673]|uniref:hypothetical protein n=1 Tax=Kitasatospora sp. NPDC059673 TaxID=3346901 RepID=UPI0036B86C26